MGKRKKQINITVYLDGEVYIEGNRIPEEEDEEMIITVVNDYLATTGKEYRVEKKW